MHPLRPEAESRLRFCGRVQTQQLGLVQSSNFLQFSPQEYTRNDLTRSKIIKIFLGGGACPQTPLAGALPTLIAYWNPLSKILDPPLVLHCLNQHRKDSHVLVVTKQFAKTAILLYSVAKQVFGEKRPATVTKEEAEVLIKPIWQHSFDTLMQLRQPKNVVKVTQVFLQYEARDPKLFSST